MTAKEFIQSIPAKVDPKQLEGIETLFHFDIAGTGGGQFSVEVKDQQLSLQEGLLGEPKCVVTTKDTVLVDLVSGKLNPVMALLTKKVKISNQAELLKNAKLFGLM